MNANPAKILVVDDDDDFRMALCHLLRANGFQAFDEGKPLAVLKTVAETNPDLILLDLYMPDVSGDKLLQTIRDCGLDIPVIVISGKIGIEQLTTLQGHGVEHILAKPVSKSVLMEKIRNVIPLAG